MNEENALDSALSSFVASITEIFPNLSWGRFLAAVGIIAVVIVLLVILRQLMRLFSAALNKWGKSSKSFENQFRVAYNIIRVILIVVAVLTIMQVFGINVSAIVAGLGIASVIVGLVLQETLRDIVMSIRIVMDGYFRVGDVIRFNDIEGEGDQLYTEAVHTLFTTAADPLAVTAWVEIFARLERCLDACEHVADQVDTVLMKNY